jgi:hypothetical protein
MDRPTVLGVSHMGILNGAHAIIELEDQWVPKPSSRHDAYGFNYPL